MVKKKSRKGNSLTKIKGTINSKFDLLAPIFTDSIPFSRDQIRILTDTTVSNHNKIIEGFGIVHGTKRWKAICLHAINILDGRTPVKETFSVGLKDHWPKALGHLRPVRDVFLDTTLDPKVRGESYRLILTLCKINSVCRDNSELDVNNIQKTFTISKELEDEFYSYLQSRIDPDQVDTNLEKLFVVEPVYGPANGPNRLPKLQSATAESIALLNGKLGKPFKDYCHLTNNNDFLNYVEDYSSRDNMEETGKLKGDNVILRKLTSVADKGNKSRTVAICDFWTQTLLAPLEASEENELRKKFSSKSAFYSHSDGFKKVLSEYDSAWKSIDASQWTDNFPSRLQYLYLKLRYGKQLAHAWRQLVVDCSWTIGNTKHTIKYGKGQGMGTKGSFMIASVTDHYFIEFLSEKHYGKIVPYNKVGDDLVISDVDNVYIKNYPMIGVEINLNKTKISTSNGNFVEYVSRSGWNREDVSPISSNLISRIRRQPLLFPVLIGHIKERMPGFSLENSYHLISELDINSNERERIHKLCILYQRLTGVAIIKSPPDIDEELLVTNQTVINCLFRLIDETDKEIQKYSIDLDESSSTQTREKSETLVNEFSISEVSLYRFATDRKLLLSEIQLTLMALKELNTRRYEEDHLAIGISPRVPDLQLSSELAIGDHTLPSMIIDALILAGSKRLSIKLIDNHDPKSPKNTKAIAHFLKALNRILKAETESPLSGTLTSDPKYLMGSKYKVDLNRMIQSSLPKAIIAVPTDSDE